MKKKGWTDKQLKYMKPDPDRRIEVPIGSPTGLYLNLYPSGRKSWAFRYRWHGRTRKMTLSETYPDLGLAAARAEANAAVDLLDQDIDPAGSQQQEMEAEALKQESVLNVAKEWVKRGLQKKESDRGETNRILMKETKGWHTRDIDDIQKPDVLRLLDSIVDRGAPVMACRTRSVLLRFFKWAKGRGYIEQSPMLDVPKPGPDHQDRDRVLTPDELEEVWAAAAALGYPSGQFVHFLILTAQRRGEVATMRWRDVDLDKSLWTLPAEVTKPGRLHDVPLSTIAVAILNELPRFKKGDYIWTTTSGQIPTNNFSKTKDRIDEEILKRRVKSTDDEKAKNIPDWTMHDLRRTAATQMAKAGVPPHVLSAILNHTPGSIQGVTSIYNRFRYSGERRAALQAWADFVAALVRPRTGAKAAAS
jgi:integrase